jgi:hypothetical protein
MDRRYSKKSGARFALCSRSLDPVNGLSILPLLQQHRKYLFMASGMPVIMSIISHAATWANRDDISSSTRGIGACPKVRRVVLLR